MSLFSAVKARFYSEIGREELAGGNQIDVDKRYEEIRREEKRLFEEQRRQEEELIKKSEREMEERIKEEQRRVSLASAVDEKMLYNALQTAIRDAAQKGNNSFRFEITTNFLREKTLQRTISKLTFAKVVETWYNMYGILEFSNKWYATKLEKENYGNEDQHIILNFSWD